MEEKLPIISFETLIPFVVPNFRKFSTSMAKKSKVCANYAQDWNIETVRKEIHGIIRFCRLLGHLRQSKRSLSFVRVFSTWYSLVNLAFILDIEVNHYIGFICSYINL